MNKCLLVIVLMLLIAVATVQSQNQKQVNTGDCPPPIVSQFCTPMCREDYHCPRNEKCCRTTCGGLICVLPVTKRLDKDKSNSRCPNKRTGPWVCSNTCSYDSDCRGRNKCCPGRCPGSMICQKPEQ